MVSPPALALQYILHLCLSNEVMPSQAINQWKPTPPLEELEPHIRRLWKARLTDKEIIAELRKHIDTTRYGIGKTKFIEIRKRLGLLRARQQGHTPESIRPAMVELRAMFPTAGAREMVSLLFHEWNLCVPRSVVRKYFTIHEPELVRQRKASRLQRRRFWAAGVNDIWAVDQHDKWLRFGLALHTGIEPFSGRILWMKIWHSNRNPQLILSYYLEAVRDLGLIPLVTQSDPGTENFGIANAHTTLRQMLDPALEGFIQHRWMRQKKNMMPEIAWSQLRRHFTPGFESLLDKGVEAGWYNVGNTLQQMIFRWLFVPWLQQELNAYVDRVNNTRKRRDRNKVLPHGIPLLVHTSSEDYGALDFKVMITPELINHVSQLYITPAHPVFKLVPPALNTFIGECYDLIGRPPMSRTSAWQVYCQLLAVAQEHVATSPLLVALDANLAGDAEMGDSEFNLLPNLQDLPYHETADEYYMGGVGGGTGLQDEHIRMLNKLIDEDEPNVGNAGADEMDAPPTLLINAFSDEEPEVDDNIDDEWY